MPLLACLQHSLTLACALLLMLPWVLFLRDNASVGNVLTEPAASQSVTGQISSTATSTAPTQRQDLEEDCGPNPLDEWKRPLTKAVLLDDLGGSMGAAVGNQLFTAAGSVVLALRRSLPLIVAARGKHDFRQIHEFPCLRSSEGIEDVILETVCNGCQGHILWKDKNRTCNKARGCRWNVTASMKLAKVNTHGTVFHQDLSEWQEPPSKFLPAFRRLFYVPLKPPSAVPAPTDLVIHFRPFYPSTCFDGNHLASRLASVPFAFYQWVVDRHARTVNQPFTLWVVSDAKKRVHPTLKRLQRDLGAKVFQDMDNTTNPWLGDFAFVQAASYVVVSTSTFSWWSAFLSHANIIYTPLLPLPTLLPWCKLLPEDPRYVFHDFYADETFNTSGPAKARCQLYERCRKQKTCVALGRLVSQYYPEVLATFKEGSRDLSIVRRTNTSD